MWFADGFGVTVTTCLNGSPTPLQAMLSDVTKLVNQALARTMSSVERLVLPLVSQAHCTMSNASVASSARQHTRTLLTGRAQRPSIPNPILLHIGGAQLAGQSGGRKIGHMRFRIPRKTATEILGHLWRALSQSPRITMTKILGHR